MTAERVTGGVPRWVWALTLYTAVAIAMLGRAVLLHPGTACACVGPAGDPPAYMWGLSWWPYAIGHGMNPFVTHMLWVPGGADVAAAAMIPGAALALWPVTAMFGAVVSYNVLAILSPALSALTMYLLARRLTGREGPSILAGYLFGFGTYQMTHLLGHANLMLVFLIPAMAHLTLRRHARELRRRRFIVGLSLLFAGQVLLSTELMLDVTLIGACALAVGYSLAPSGSRRRVAMVAAEVAGAGLLAALLTSPYLYFALTGTAHAVSGFSDTYSLDALNIFVPTRVTWLGGHMAQPIARRMEAGNLAETDGYIGLPLIFAFAAYARGTFRSRAATRVLVGILAVCLVAALGPHLTIAGQRGIALPWRALEELPMFSDAAPGRIAVFVELVVALGIAYWLADSPRGTARRRWIVVALGTVALLPNVTAGLWSSRAENPSFFATSQHRRYLRHDETVLVLPYNVNGYSMLWQAETGFYFRMPGGYLSSAIPKEYAGSATVQTLVANGVPSAARLIAFLHHRHVADVVVADSAAARWSGTLANAGLVPRHVGGVMLYRVGAETPALAGGGSPTAPRTLD